MHGHTQPVNRDDLLTRRLKLEQSLATEPGDEQLRRLLQQVDAALARMDRGAYGLCETCGDSIESERLVADPLARYCVDHLPPSQRDALNDDLILASHIQKELLPRSRLQVADWESAYCYEAAGVVSGDYCDLLSHNQDLYFVVGDVSGKGVSAAMLMTHLHATFRALVFQGLPLEQIMVRASRTFCESSLSTHFATLACGRADAQGNIELSSAGHDPALVVRGSEIEQIGATGLPLGMFCDQQFTTAHKHLDPGEYIFLYTDGLTESRNPTGEEYGVERLVNALKASRGSAPQEVVTSCLADLDAFRSGVERVDDLTLLVIRRL